MYKLFELKTTYVRNRHGIKDKSKRNRAIYGLFYLFYVLIAVLNLYLAIGYNSSSNITVLNITAAICILLSLWYLPRDIIN